MSGTPASNAKSRRAGLNRNPATVPAMRTIEQLLAANLRLTEQVVELARLVIEGRQPTPAVPIFPAPAALEQGIPWSTEPLYESEEVEDAKYQYRTGQIDHDQLSRILDDAGFQNTEIDLSL